MQGVITAPPGVSMRRATEADFDGIKQLTASSIALKGADFLVANYHEYIHEPERYLYVALKDDRVVRKTLFWGVYIPPHVAYT